MKDTYRDQGRSVIFLGGVSTDKVLTPQGRISIFEHSIFCQTPLGVAYL